MMDVMDLLKRGLGDAVLHAIKWTDTGLALELELPDTEQRVTLCFEYVVNLRLDFDCGEVSGHPLIWESSISTPDGSKRFSLDCRPEGLLSFNFSDVRLV